MLSIEKIRAFLQADTEEESLSTKRRFWWYFSMWIVTVFLYSWMHKHLLWDLFDRVPSGVFHASHVWCFHHISTMVYSGDFSMWTNQIGYPEEVTVRFIGWVPALFSAIFQGMLGSIASYNLSLLCCTALNTPMVMLLCRSLEPKISFLSASLLGLVVAFSPPIIGALVNGQICKAQIWLPALFSAYWMWQSKKTHTENFGKTLLQSALGIVFLAIAMAFTEPTFCLFMALIVIGWAILWVVQSKFSVAQIVHQAVLGISSALVFWMASRYYDTEGLLSGFTPSSKLSNVGVVNTTLQQVSIQELLGTTKSTLSSTGTIHYGYLGLWNIVMVLCILVGGMWWKRREKNANYSALLFAGVSIVVATTLSLGEFALWDKEYWMIGDNMLALPALWLAQWGYPLVKSGEYYRGLLFTWLALPVLVGSVSGIVWKYARYNNVGVAVVALSMLGNSFWVTWASLPLSTSAVLGKPILEYIADHPGAVFDMPLGIGNHQLGVVMRDASVHGQPVPVVPTYMPIADHPLFRKKHQQLLKALYSKDKQRIVESLSALGYRYIVWRKDRFDGKLQPHELESVLGTPQRSGNLLLWDVSVLLLQE